MEEILSARQVPKASTEDHQTDHVAWSFPCFFTANVILDKDIPNSIQACCVTEGGLTLIFLSPTLLASAARKEKNIAPEYFHTT